VQARVSPDEVRAFAKVAAAVEDEAHSRSRRVTLQRA